MYLKKTLLTGFFILLLLGLYVLPTVNSSKNNGVNAAEKREKIAENGLGGLPTVVVLVDFVREQRIDEADFLRGLFAGENSINSYFKEISYESLWLEKDDLYHVKVDSPASHYSWGYTATDLETDKVKELTLDVYEKVLESAPEAVFQDKIVIFVLNVSTEEMQGRGAMCLVPGNTPFPKKTYPENQELFVGYFRESPKDPEIRKACFIDTTYPFNSPDQDKGYINERRVEFHRADKQDEFIRGLAIFCNDALLSCAVHDVLHTVKRFSDRIPTSDNPGARARAIPCLYSLALQTEWLNSGNLAIYCTPFVGWWDNTGDHQHLNPDDRNGFMDGDPYGVSAFTKLRLGVIPEVEVRGDSAFQLAALALPDCPQDALRAVKIPLDESGNEYLLVEYRRNIPGTVEGVKVNHDILMGHGGPTDPVNPPKYLVPGKGVLVYHVNENEDIREAGCPTTKPWPEGCPEDPTVLGITRNNQFVTNFVIFLYTPSMIENNVPGGIVDYPTWHEYTVRRPIDLRDAGFYPGKTFKLRRNQEIITIHVVDFDDQLAQVEVTREST